MTLKTSILAASLSASAMFLVAGAQAGVINVAVIADNSGHTGGAAQVAAQLNSDPNFQFNATVLADSSVTSLASLSGYNAVVIGGSGFSTNAYSSADLAAVNAFAQAGGGVVTTGWYEYAVQSLSSSDKGNAAAITPIALGPYSFTTFDTLNIVNGTNPVTQGVSPFGESGCCFETASNGVDPGAIVLATSTVDGQPIVVELGDEVYLGALYMGDPLQYTTGYLTTGAPEQLLAQSLEFVSGASAAPAPEPASLVLLSVGLAGVGVSRRRRKA